MFLAVRKRLEAAKRAQEAPDYTVENSGLNRTQIGLGIKTLSRLGLGDRLTQLIKQDMLNFMYGVGMNPTPDLIDAKLRQLKLHRKDSFTWDELSHLWRALLQDHVDEEEVLWRAFQFFDRDGNGDISVSELESTMAELGGYLSTEELQRFIRLMDANNDGVIGYLEFLEVLRTQAPPETQVKPAVAASRRASYVRSARQSGAGGFAPQREARQASFAGVMGASKEGPLAAQQPALLAGTQDLPYTASPPLPPTAAAAAAVMPGQLSVLGQQAHLQQDTSSAWGATQQPSAAAAGTWQQAPPPGSSWAAAAAGVQPHQQQQQQQQQQQWQDGASNHVRAAVSPLVGQQAGAAGGAASGNCSPEPWAQPQELPLGPPEVSPQLLSGQVAAEAVSGPREELRAQVTLHQG